MTFFRVYGIGNFTRTPELKYLPSGTPVANWGMAANYQFTKDGEKKQEVCFVDCAAFGKTAETVCQYLKKGSRVHVEGRLSFRSWQTEDGQKRSKLEIIADRVTFLDKAPGGNGDGGESGEEEDGPR